MKTAAFFDLDGTIINGNSGLRFMEFLYANRILKVKKSTILPALKVAYSYLFGDMQKAVDDADNLMALALKGVSKKEVERASEFFAVSDVKNFNDKILERIEFHRKNKHMLILLSVSPDELIKKMSKLLKFDYGLGSRFKEKDGIYTGELIIPSMIGKERAELVKEIAKKFEIDLNKSYAYGNCINDLEVLELTGNPYAVNPNKALSPVARKKGIKIL